MGKQVIGEKFTQFPPRNGSIADYLGAFTLELCKSHPTEPVPRTDLDQ